MVKKINKIKKIKKSQNKDVNNQIIGFPFLLNNNIQPNQIIPLLNYPKIYIYFGRPIVALILVYLIVWIIIKIHLYFSKNNMSIKDKLENMLISKSYTTNLT